MSTDLFERYASLDPAASPQAAPDWTSAAPVPLAAIDERIHMQMHDTMVKDLETDAPRRVAPRKRLAAFAFGAVVLLVGVVGGVLLSTGGGETPTGPETSAINWDFETGDLTGWKTLTSTTSQYWADWVIYEEGQDAPAARNEVAQGGLGFPAFSLPDPPQGRFAATTDGNGPHFTILYRDIFVEGPSALTATIFYDSNWPISAPDHFRSGSSPGAPSNQQYRIDLVVPSAQVYTIADEEILATVFRTADGDPTTLEPTRISFDLSPWEGQTVRLRFVQVANQGPIFSGVDDVRVEALVASS